MVNPFKVLGKGVKALWGFFTPGSSADRAIKATLTEIASVLGAALAAAKFVTSLTPTKTDDAIVDQIAYWTEKARELGVDSDAAAVKGLQLAVASASLRQKLIEALAKCKDGIEFAGKILKTAEDIAAIPDSLLRAASELGYQIEKRS